MAGHGGKRPPLNVSPCSFCGRDVGVMRSWNDWQVSKANGEWKLSRHSTTAPTGTQRARRPICLGSGLVVPDAVVFPNDDVAVAS